jgi:hypothetical protein
MIKAVYTGGTLDGTFCCDRVPQSFKHYMQSLGFRWVDDGPDGVVFEGPEDQPLDTVAASEVLTQAYAQDGWNEGHNVYVGVVAVEIEEG